MQNNYGGAVDMELLVIVLNETEHLMDILDGFIKYNIKGATIVDSAGMGHLMASHIPLFYQFAQLERTGENNSKTIFTVINNDEDKENILKVLDSILGDISEPNTAFVFSLPVNFVRGIRSEKSGDRS